MGTPETPRNVTMACTESMQSRFEAACRVVELFRAHHSNHSTNAYIRACNVIDAHLARFECDAPAPPFPPLDGYRWVWANNGWQQEEAPKAELGAAPSEVCLKDKVPCPTDEACAPPIRPGNYVRTKDWAWVVVGVADGIAELSRVSICPDGKGEMRYQMRVPVGELVRA